MSFMFFLNSCQPLFSLRIDNGRYYLFCNDRRARLVIRQSCHSVFIVRCKTCYGSYTHKREYIPVTQNIIYSGSHKNQLTKFALTITFVLLNSGQSNAHSYI